MKAQSKLMKGIMIDPTKLMKGIKIDPAKLWRGLWKRGGSDTPAIFEWRGLWMKGILIVPCDRQLLLLLDNQLYIEFDMARSL